MFKRFVNQSVSKFWMLLYLILLLIPALSNLYMIIRVNDGLKEEYKNLNTFMLKNASTVLDGMFGDVEKLKTSITTYSAVIDIARRKQLDEHARFDAAMLSNEFNRKTDMYKYVSDFYIYYPNTDLIVTSNGFYESNIFFTRQIAHNNISYGEWKQNLLSSRVMDTIESTVIQDGKELAAFEFLFPVSKREEVGGFIVCIRVIKDNIFGDLIEASKKENSMMAILFSRGDLYIHYGNNDINIDFKSLSLKNEFEISSIIVNGKKMNISYVRSSNRSYRYVYLSRVGQASQRAQRTLVSIIVSTCTSLLVMMVIMYHFNKWNYRKIRHIVNSFSDISEENSHNVNEYAVITQHIETVKVREKRLRNELEKLKDIGRNGFLVDYIKGYIDIREKNSKFLSYNINFEYNSYALVGIDIRDFGVAGRGTKRDAVFVVENITMDCVDDGICFIAVEVDGMLFYIVNAPKDTDIKKEIFRIFSHVLEIAQNVLGINFLTVISSVAYDDAKIPDLYHEVINAIEYGNFYGIENFIFYDNLKLESAMMSVRTYNTADENALIYNIKEGNYKESQKIIEELLFLQDSGMYLDKWKSNWMAYNIINTITKSIDSADERDTSEILNYISGIDQCDNIDEMKMFFEKLLELCIGFNKKRNIKDERVYDMVKKLVDSNITNECLNVFWVGEELGMSSLYLSRIFKNYSGIKLSSYINNMRIEQAKQKLLSNCSLKIEEISMLVGFSNTRTFLKVFKEKEGVTPTQFRNSKR